MFVLIDSVLSEVENLELLGCSICNTSIFWCAIQNCLIYLMPHHPSWIILVIILQLLNLGFLFSLRSCMIMFLLPFWVTVENKGTSDGLASAIFCEIAIDSIYLSLTIARSYNDLKAVTLIGHIKCPPVQNLLVIVLNLNSILNFCAWRYIMLKYRMTKKLIGELKVLL